jgi:hypothetical protein|tara:strand:+ start:626 stop:784 length:159 start_codon:yes stop_codon:yes gene_type:complete
MIEWEVIGLAAVVAVIIYYWYNPNIFKIHPEKRYPENYGKHPDPHHYKKDYK